MDVWRIVLVAAAVAVFGVLVPWVKGIDFLDPRLIVGYACLSAVLAAPASADSLASNPDLAPADRLRRAFILTAYASGFSVVTIALALTTVNFMNWHGRLLLPRTPFLIACVFLSLAAPVCVTGISAALAGRASPHGIKTILRILFLALIAALVLLDRFSPSALGAAMTTRGLTRIALIASFLLMAAGAGLLSIPRRVS